MTELVLSSPQPTRQALAVKDRSAPLKVTGKLKVALDAMVWQGARRAEAAQIGGITDHSLRSALNKPHVKRYYLAQLEVLRTSERARNIHRLREIRDAANNMPAVQAIRDLERAPDDAQIAGGAARSAPGVTIVVMTGTAAPTQAQVIDVTGDEPR
jgi:hypothetical protein